MGCSEQCTRNVHINESSTPLHVALGFPGSIFGQGFFPLWKRVRAGRRWVRGVPFALKYWEGGGERLPLCNAVILFLGPLDIEPQVFRVVRAFHSFFAHPHRAARPYAWRCTRRRTWGGTFHRQYRWKSCECYTWSLNEAHATVDMSCASNFDCAALACKPLMRHCPSAYMRTFARVTTEEKFQYHFQYHAWLFWIHRLAASEAATDYSMFQWTGKRFSQSAT